jgi:hypothetical protein
MNAYKASEYQAEVNLNNTLKERFKKIADRLTDCKNDRDIQVCAQKILGRQIEINSELENLHLPNLTGKHIEEITDPVFNAAKQILQ